jgi:hypothetical protein
MVKTIGLLLLLTITVTAQAPLLRLATKDGQQFKLIVERQAALANEFQQLEQSKLIIKLRACLEQKLDAPKCDAMEVVPDGEGFALRERPKAQEKNP